jgi:hypothetical protein
MSKQAPFRLFGGPSCVVVPVSFEAQSGTPAQTKIRDGNLAKILSITRASAGVYTVQLDKNYYRQIIPFGRGGVAASGAIRNGVVEIDEASYDKDTGAFTIRHALSAAPTTPADPANGDRVNFAFVGTFAPNALQGLT